MMSTVPVKSTLRRLNPLCITQELQRTSNIFKFGMHSISIRDNIGELDLLAT